MIYAITSIHNNSIVALYLTVVIYRVINLANGITALLISDLRDKTSTDDDVDGMKIAHAVIDWSCDVR